MNLLDYCDFKEFEKSAEAPLALFFLKSKSRDNEDKELPLRTSKIRAGRIFLIVILASFAYFIIQILVNRFYLQ